MNAVTRQTTRQARPNSLPKRYLALVTLLFAGLLLALSTNMAKIAHEMGFSPLSFLTWSLTGATLLLTVVSFFRGQYTKANKRTLEYFIVSGFLSTAATNMIFFSAVNHLGVSFVALMMALPPLLTYLGALLLRMERFCVWRAIGVTLALVGTTLLVFKKWTSPDANPVWILMTLMGPILLSAGNLYRSHRWPPGASAESLAPGMLVSATSMLILFSLLPGWTLTIPTENAKAIPLLGITSIIFAGQFLLLFFLQKTGGPVLLSLMGGVSAIFGVPIAMALFNEPVLPAFLVSALFMAAGIVCMLYGAKACQRQINFTLQRTDSAQ